MKKLISMILCVAMLTSMALLFASCKKDGDVQPVASKKTVSVDLSDYSVVYGEELTDSGRQDVNLMLTNLKTLTGAPIRSFPALWRSPMDWE